MIKFRSCPKCQGDLQLGKDRFGTFVSCLQCGFIREVGFTPEGSQKERRISRNKAA